jgi:protein-S-isoprenylcysteine O-methyltransferase Ste14
MAPLFLFMFFSTFGEVENDLIVFPLGGLLFGTGLVIRIWAQMHLHYRLRVKKSLTITGPYSHVRNPIYIANTFLMLGACATSELIWLLPFVLVWCILLYNLVVRYEESHLRRKYGRPYLEYTRQVSRWFPRGFRATESVPTREFFARSVRAELFCFLYIFPFIIKEVLF